MSFGGTFTGINTALRGLMAQQAAMDTTGHNLANVNTEGYSRQRADLVTSSPLSMPGYNMFLPGQLGTGVDVQGYSRMRDQYLDATLRDQNSRAATSDTTVDLLNQVQAAFGEPGPTGLNAQIQRFFTAMHDVAANPQDMASRQALAQQGDALARAFNNLDSQLKGVAGTSNARLNQSVVDVNTIATSIAALNSQIKDAKLSGLDANDLKDSRDLLMDKLALQLNYTATTNNATDEVTITVGGGPTLPAKILVDPSVAGGVTPINRADLDDWSDPGNPPPGGNLTQGQIYADEQMWNPAFGSGAIGTIQTITNNMDSLVASMVGSLNLQNGAGFDLTGAAGGPLFAGVTMATVSFSAAVLSNPSLIAAASSWNAPGEPGNGNNAATMLAMAQAPQAPLLAAWQSFYSSVVSGVGTMAQTAQQTSANQGAVVDALTARREAVSSVSIDEEMTNMMRFQHAYQASARVMSAVDDMLDTLVNRTGRVGL